MSVPLAEGALMKLDRLIRRWLAMLGVAAASCIALQASAGQYALAFWRKAGAYENQAPPAGDGGNRSAYVHVWDESGQLLAGKQIHTSWGVLLRTNDANGFVEIVLHRRNGYDFQVRDDSYQSDTTPMLSVRGLFSPERAVSQPPSVQEVPALEQQLPPPDQQHAAT
jgi:hypothetical protein